MIELSLVVGLVIVTSAACSVLEAVLYSVPPGHVNALERSGRASGRILRRLRGEVDRPIAAVLSLNTLANTGGSAVAGAMAAGVLGTAWVGYFSAALTLGILMLSEIIPKTAGVVYSRQLARVIARPLQLLVYVFAPVIWLSRFVTKVIARDHEGDRVSDEELLVMVGLGLRSGAFKPQEAAVIQNILALEAKTARDIMTPRTVVFSLSAETTVREAAAESRLLRYSRVLVYDRTPDDVVGIVHRVDVLRAAADDQFDVKVGEFMHPAYFVVESARLDRLLRTFLERRQHMVAVIDEFGSLDGIVTLEDVLEEILGREIVDETDQVTDLRVLARRRREETLGRTGLRQ